MAGDATEVQYEEYLMYKWVFCLQYEDVGEEAVSMLDGMFSFVLVDNRDNSFIAARDPIGITPLYLGWGNDGRLLMLSLR